MRQWRSCSVPDVDAHDALVSNPLSTFHRHQHLLAHALCCMLQSQEHSPYALKSWGGHTRCDLAPQSTSFGTVALRERQHLAMAGSRHLHFPRNATAHCAARANYHVPHWCSVLAETDADPSSAGSASATQYVRERGVDTKAALVVRCLAPLPLSSFPHALLPCWSRGDLSV